MHRKDLFEAAAKFAEEELLPKVKSDFKRWALGGALPSLPNLLDRAAVEYMPMLHALGIMDAEGEVDRDGLQRFLDGAFKSQPSLELHLSDLIGGDSLAMPLVKGMLDLSFAFTADDTDRILAAVK